MPQMTYPNQRMIKIHRERTTADFLGIKNENWQAASRDLGHTLYSFIFTLGPTKIITRFCCSYF